MNFTKNVLALLRVSGGVFTDFGKGFSDRWSEGKESGEGVIGRVFGSLGAGLESAVDSPNLKGTIEWLTSENNGFYKKLDSQYKNKL